MRTDEIRRLLHNVASPSVQMLGHIALAVLAAATPVGLVQRIAAVVLSVALSGALKTLQEQDKQEAN